MNYKSIAVSILLSTIANLGVNFSTYAVDSDTVTAEEEVTTPRPNNSETPTGNTTPKPVASTTQTESNCADLKLDPKELKSKRVDLFYYRNAKNIISILNKLPIKEPKGCATELPLNAPAANAGVGRGGGNVVLLYGTQEYIDRTHRLITALDLPLTGINLELWGIQVSSKKPEKLAQAMTRVRGEIDQTQQFIRESFSLLQQFTAEILEDSAKNFDAEFIEVVKAIGYESFLDPSRRLSLLDVIVIGNFVENPVQYYKSLYKNFKSLENDLRYKAYFTDAQKSGRIPFSRFLRSRGFGFHCPTEHQVKLKKTEHIACNIEWQLKEKGEEKGLGKSLVDKLATKRRKAILEFAFQYANFVSNPDSFNFERLSKAADTVNTELQNMSNVIQKDISDFYTRPTLAKIQKVVRETKKVTFAQVGRNTISSLNGVSTFINSKSNSVFQVAESQDAQQLISRAKDIQEIVPAAFGLPNAAALAQSGVPASQLLGLAIALTEQRIKPIEAETGTSLTVTPGILRNLTSAELNLHLIVADPKFSATGDQGTSDPQISRVGVQEVITTVYTQAVDFFDLSTFTHQATLDGGRFRIPVIGHIWHAIFGGIPGFGDLFSFSRGNQNVYHESLLLTNSFIIPTPLGIGLNFPIDSQAAKDKYSKDLSLSQLKSLEFIEPVTSTKFCKTQSTLVSYLDRIAPAAIASSQRTEDPCILGN